MRASVVGQAAVIMARRAASNLPVPMPSVAPKGFFPESLTVAKGAVDSLTTSDEGWLGTATPYGTAVAAYYAVLKSSSAWMAVMARELIPRVPFHRAVAAAAADATAWVLGEGAAVALSRFTLDRRLLEPRTIVALLVASRELVDGTGEGGSQLIDTMLQNAAGTMADKLFRDLTIDSSVSSIVSAGASAINAAADIRAALQAVFSAGQLATHGFWIFSVDAALAAATMVDAEGLPSMPEMGINGGMIAGLPAFVSSGWPSRTVTLFDGGQLVANTDNIGLAVSGNAAVEMVDSNPVNDAATGQGAQMVSTFQTYGVAIKQTLRVGVERVRDTAAAEIVNVSW